MKFRVAIAAGLLLTLTGCWDDEQKAQVYSSIEQCKAEQSEADCNKAFEGAKEEQAKTAPHYNALDVCEAQYGAARCEVHHDENGNSWFYPAMLGFMLGRESSGPVYYRPVYTDVYGYAYTGRDRIGGYRPGTTYVYTNRTVLASPSARTSVWSKPYVAPPTRGGFGTSASINKGVGGITSTPSNPSSVTRGGFGSSSSLSTSKGTASPSFSPSRSSTSTSSISRGGFGSSASHSSSGS